MLSAGHLEDQPEALPPDLSCDMPGQVLAAWLVWLLMTLVLLLVLMVVLLLSLVLLLMVLIQVLIVGQMV